MIEYLTGVMYFVEYLVMILVPALVVGVIIYYLSGKKKKLKFYDSFVAGILVALLGYSLFAIIYELSKIIKYASILSTAYISGGLLAVLFNIVIIYFCIKSIIAILNNNVSPLRYVLGIYGALTFFIIIIGLLVTLSGPSEGFLATLGSGLAMLFVWGILLQYYMDKKKATSSISST